MKLLITLIAVFFLGATLLGQVEEYSFSGDYFEVDHLGNVYSISSNSVSMLNDTGEVKYTFSDISLGDISSIDVSNPMKIVVFYKNSGKIFILDNQLSLHNDPLDLFQLVERDIQFVANSGSNNLWLYDQFSNQIIQVDYSMKITNSTGVLTGFLPYDFTPSKIIEKTEKLFVLSTKSELAVFDIFGSFLYKIILPNVSDFQIENNQVIYQKGKTMCFYNLLTHLEECVEIPVENDAIIKKQGNRYFSLLKGDMKVFE